ASAHRGLDSQWHRLGSLVADGQPCWGCGARGHGLRTARAESWTCCPRAAPTDGTHAGRGFPGARRAL
ncbi:unnamed protein product, partial [Symbiodinium sp. CCMP2592]